MYTTPEASLLVSLTSVTALGTSQYRANWYSPALAGAKLIVAVVYCSGSMLPTVLFITVTTDPLRVTVRRALKESVATPPRLFTWNEMDWKWHWLATE